MALLRRLSPPQNLITMRTSGAGLTLLESQLQRLPDIEQTVIFVNQLYITSRDEAKLKSALFAFTQQGYEFCKVDTNLEDAFTYLMKNNCEKINFSSLRGGLAWLLRKFTSYAVIKSASVWCS